MTDMYDEPKVSSVALPAYEHSERGAPVSICTLNNSLLLSTYWYHVPKLFYHSRFFPFHCTNTYIYPNKQIPHYTYSLSTYPNPKYSVDVQKIL